MPMPLDLVLDHAYMPAYEGDVNDTQAEVQCLFLGI